MGKHIRLLSFATVLVALLTAATLLGCKSSSKETPKATATTAKTTPEGERGSTVVIELSEWKFTGAAGAAIPTVKSGEVTFEAHNLGEVPHEMVILKTDTDPAALPKKDGDVDEEAAGAIGEVEQFDPGKTETGTFRLEPGKYVLICNISGHYAQGMHAQLIVQ